MKEQNLDLATKPTKQDLFNYPIGTKIITDKLNQNVFWKLTETTFENNDHIIKEEDIDENLKIVDYTELLGKEIVQIELPEYTVVYKKTLRKMTLQEIEDRLGYDIEIIETVD